MKHVLYTLCMLLFLSACNSGERKTDRLYEEVMDLHDEAMNKMGNVMHLQKELDEHIQELQAADSSANNMSRIEYLQQLKESLAASDEGMMQWMRSFDNEMDGMDTEQKQAYLQDQKQEIQDIDEALNTAIQNAEEALE